jgi:frataxin
MPETDNPVKQGVEETQPSVGVAELSDGEYHELADHYLEIVLSKFEQLQDAREDIDIEYSVSALHHCQEPAC